MKGHHKVKHHMKKAAHHAAKAEHHSKMAHDHMHAGKEMKAPAKRGRKPKHSK